MKNDIKGFLYICYNDNCYFTPITDENEHGREPIIVIKYRKEEDKEEICDHCKEVMVNKGTIEANKFIFDKMTFAYTRFNSLSSDKKKEVLGKRAKAHFKTHIAEKKYLMDRGLPT